MRIPKSIVLVAVGMIAGATIVGGVAVDLTAGASGPNTTYYACLRSGGLTGVGTTPPTCRSTATRISWNSVGPQGPPGAAGACAGVPHVGVDLSGCDLTGAYLENANFTNANLTDANLTNVDLTSATVTGADLSGAILAGANFAGSFVSGGITGTPASLPTGWSLADGYLVSSTVNLTGANLTGADLANLDLSSATLADATLTGADLPART